MKVDDARMVEIEGSPVKMLALLLAGVLMTALSIAIAVPLIESPRITSFVQFVGYIGVPFFGLCTGMIFWRLLTMRGPVVTIAPQGIRDRRVAAELIPWKAIRGISTWEHGRQKVMVLNVDPAFEKQLSLTRVAQWSRGPNRKLGIDGLCVTAQGLKIDYDTLLNTTTAYAEAARG